MKIVWKSNQIKTKNSTLVRLIADNEKDNSENEEETMKFDSDLFLKRVRLLINQNQTDIIYEIEEQIQPFDISELFAVLNSQLAKFIFNQIETLSKETPKKYITTCLNLCVFFTTVYTKKEMKFAYVQEHYLEYITFKFIENLKEVISYADSTIQPLLIISNTFFLTIEIYNNIDIIGILEHFIKNGEEQELIICSLIMKRLLRCDFLSDSFIKFPNSIMNKIIEFSTVFIESDLVYSQIKTLQLLSKIVLNYSDQLTIQNKMDLNKLINKSILQFADPTEIPIFGNVLYLILTVIEINQNNKAIFSFLNEIPICEIVKNGLDSDVSFIQSASSDILMFIITFPSSLTNQLLAESDMINFIFQKINGSDFSGKEKIRKAVFGLFWRDDFNLDELFDKEGILFLVESLCSWPKEILPIMNMIIIKFPQSLDIFLDLSVIDELDEIIFNDQDVDKSVHISAQALKKDILKLAGIEEHS